MCPLWLFINILSHLRSLCTIGWGCWVWRYSRPFKISMHHFFNTLNLMSAIFFRCLVKEIYWLRVPPEIISVIRTIWFLGLSSQECLRLIIFGWLSFFRRSTSSAIRKISSSVSIGSSTFLEVYCRNSIPGYFATSFCIEGFVDEFVGSLSDHIVRLNELRIPSKSDHKVMVHRYLPLLGLHCVRSRLRPCRCHTVKMQTVLSLSLECSCEGLRRCLMNSLLPFLLASIQLAKILHPTVQFILLFCNPNSRCRPLPPNYWPSTLFYNTLDLFFPF